MLGERRPSAHGEQTDLLLQSGSEAAQFALAERVARFGYWSLRLKDNRSTWSPGMYRLLEVDPEVEADQKWLLDQIQPDDVVLLLDQIKQAIRNRAPFSYRSRAKDPNSAVQIVDTHGDVQVGSDGRVVSLIGVCHDVTQQVLAETGRSKAEKMYRVMTEEASDIIILYSADGHVLFASSALERILKRTIPEIEDGKFLDLVHPEDIEEATKIHRMPNPGETIVTSYRVRHGDGHYVWMEAQLRATYDEAGNPQNMISVSRDVSERKAYELKILAAQKQAEAANKAKSTFLANMSHELRTPLNAIIGFADIMREEMFGPLGSKRYGEYARLILDSGQLLLDLITDVLDMAKIEAGKLDLQLEPVNLASAITDCTRLLSERAERGGVQLFAWMPDGALQLTADRRAVTQIVLNLLSNAVKFTPSGGRVCVEARCQHDEIKIQVSDNGIGIAEDDLKRLGQPFEQVCGDPALSKGGTGLGLALVRALAEKHGGTLQISSKPGHGTTACVTIPTNLAVRKAA